MQDVCFARWRTDGGPEWRLIWRAISYSAARHALNLLGGGWPRSGSTPRARRTQAPRNTHGSRCTKYA
eukprot:2262076-Lingulodinium_polyedra.AAC.1